MDNMPFLYELLENCRRLVGLQAVNALEGSRKKKKNSLILHFHFPEFLNDGGVARTLLGHT